MPDVTLRSPQATRALGHRLARLLRPGDVVLLLGPVGSGKTTLVQGLARSFGVRERVTSPSFVLRKRYRVRRRTDVGIRWLHHMDAYRIRSLAALRSALDDAAADANDAVWCVEWGGRFARSLAGRRTFTFTLTVISPTARRAALRRLPAR